MGKNVTQFKDKNGVVYDVKDTNAREDISDLKSEIASMNTATVSDVDKALSPKTIVNGKVTEWQFIEGGGGASDYADLTSKPQINSVTLTGNKSLDDIGIYNVEVVRLI